MHAKAHYSWQWVPFPSVASLSIAVRRFTGASSAPLSACSLQMVKDPVPWQGLPRRIMYHLQGAIDLSMACLPVPCYYPWRPTFTSNAHVLTPCVMTGITRNSLYLVPLLCDKVLVVEGKARAQCGCVQECIGLQKKPYNQNTGISRTGF